MTILKLFAPIALPYQQLQLGDLYIFLSIRRRERRKWKVRTITSILSQDRTITRSPQDIKVPEAEGTKDSAVHLITPAFLSPLWWWGNRKSVFASSFSSMPRRQPFICNKVRNSKRGSNFNRSWSPQSHCYNSLGPAYIRSKSSIECKW